MPQSNRKRRVVFGLGSNLGNRALQLYSAIDRMRCEVDFENLMASPFYETRPVGGPIQDNYLNAAVVVETRLAGKKLLEIAMAIEREHARVRLEKNGPRTLDVDILWIDGELLEEPSLTVPHPRLHERAFALTPMLDLVPGAIDPRNGRALREHLLRVGKEGIWQFREVGDRGHEQSVTLSQQSVTLSQL